MIQSLLSNIRTYINTQEYIEQGIEKYCVQYPLNNGIIEILGDYVELLLALLVAVQLLRK